MLKTLTIHRFRLVEPGTRLDFAEGFNVLLGKNGTGKTTLLELISMIVRSDFSALRSEEFDIEYVFANEHGAGTARIQNMRMDRPRIPLQKADGRAERGPIQPEESFRPRVSFVLKHNGEEQQPLEIQIDGMWMQWRHGGEWTEVDDSVDVFSDYFLGFIRSRQAWNTRITFGMEEDAIFGGNIDALWSYRFDESLQTFDRIVGGDPRLRSIGGHFLYQGDSWVERGSDFLPFSYQPQKPIIGQSNAAVQLPPEASISRFPSLTGFDGMTLSLAVEGSTQKGTDEGGEWVEWELGHAEFMFSRPGGSINHNALSYGQKRLLAFLYYLDANEKYVVADELVNGMHHDWIRACIDLISTRQSFLTSQNPLLLDYIPLASPEQAKRTFIKCTAKPHGDRTRFVWANLSDEEAADLFADHEVGIQPVGELLRAKGLW